MSPTQPPSRREPLPPCRRGRAVAVLAALCAGVCAVVLVLGTAFPAAEALGSRGSDKRSSAYVLVYSGPVVCSGCAENLGDVVTAAGLRVRYVSRPEKVPGLLHGAGAFVVPATNFGTESMRRAFERSVLPALRRYLRAGGRYLGVCGGAFLAARLGIVPVSVATYSSNSRPHLERVRWYGRLRWMYYLNGPYFIRKSRRAPIKVIATYFDGSIAALAYRFGKGKVIVSGPHPEARRSWLVRDGIASAGWKPTFPLAIAMLRNLLS
jgi:hypothetical protein